MHIAQMGTKTISLKDEAYRRLKAARRYPDESFSEVVLRATWPENTITGRELLASLRAGRTGLRAIDLELVEELKKNDRPPEDKWADR
jgi:predicted CopG family antitoxin